MSWGFPIPKRHDKEWKIFQQNVVKELPASNSHTGTSYGEKTRIDLVLNESKLDQRVTVEEKEISADGCKRMKIDQFLLSSHPIKKIADNQEFRKKRSKTYAEVVRTVGTSNSGDEVLEQLIVPNILKEKNHDFKRIVGIDLRSTYARLMKDELLESDTLYSLPRLCTDTCASRNLSRYRKVSANLW